MFDRLLRVLCFLFVLFFIVRIGNDILRLGEARTPSDSVGSTASGSLIHGKRLPARGANFQTYSHLGSLLGRTSVNSRVRGAVLDAYAALEADLPAVKYVYGETGWPWGGSFWPHKTHQNGLSVDFMVPIRDNLGQSVRLDTAPWTRFGYDLEFDEAGIRENQRIDFGALAAHLHALADAAPNYGLRIEQVIFAPELQRYLFSAVGGPSLPDRMQFSTLPSWVRHDEHYHVDFVILF